LGGESGRNGDGDRQDGYFDATHNVVCVGKIREQYGGGRANNYSAAPLHHQGRG
jgi:hypothetical protein